jgi:hypothetical protein
MNFSKAGKVSECPHFPPPTQKISAVERWQIGVAVIKDPYAGL